MMLKISSLNAYYGNIHALKGVELEIDEGEIVALIGSNGAGKSTTLSSIAGLIKSAPGSKITYMGTDITNSLPHKIVETGISMVPEGREVFPGLSVEENLRLGAYIRSSKKEIVESYHQVYDLFPRLEERRKQTAGTLSGGEQQMLAIGRAMMSKPKLLLLDEPSLGLAPNIVQNIFRLIKRINETGVTVLLVEQNASMALKIANRGYILETGCVKLTDSAKNLRSNDIVRRAYLGQ